MLCPMCNSPIKTVAAGVSKKNGKPYNSFQACSNRNCSYKPPIDESYTPEQQPIQQAPVARNMSKACDEKKEMVMSYAKDLVVAEITTGVPSDVPTIERVEAYFDRLILKIRSV